MKRLAGKPFALLGVNSDGDRQKLKEAIKEEGITWRSWWDGGGTSGPIATQWNIRNWPTMYLLDAKGVIRHKSVGSPGDETLDKWIDELLAK
jgi:hypothetical protein